MSEQLKEILEIIVLWYILPAFLLWAEMYFCLYPESAQDKVATTFMIVMPGVNVFFLIISSLILFARFVSGFIF
jgi:hypothetical protein